MVTPPEDGSKAGPPPQGDTYQMLWDCAHCGTKKLLGLSHRHCPECGAPQNADARYFPSDADKVRVEDHVYSGKDIVCRYCGVYNGRSAKHCVDCGSPLSEGSDAQTRETELHRAGEFAGEHVARGKVMAVAAPMAAPKPKARTGLFIGLSVVGLLVVALVVFFAWKRDAAFEVTGQEWRREIDVEKFGPSKSSGWCDALPSGAKELRRYRAVRSHEKVPDGQDCQIKKVDNGDGTFTEQEHCTPKYKDEPVEADKCDFLHDTWSVERTEKASGSGASPAPSWPEVNTGEACTRVGCQRLGDKREHYIVKFRAADGSSDECDVSEAQFAKLAPGSQVSAQVRMLGGGLDCDSLTTQ